jgi:ATP-dependent Clp protease ATP-binding subunit ClpA
MSEAKMSESLTNIIKNMSDSIKNDNNGTLSPEYLVLGMIKHSDSFKNILRDLKVNVSKLKRDIEEYTLKAKPTSKKLAEDEFQNTITLQKIISRTIMKAFNSIDPNEDKSVEFNEIDLLITILEHAHYTVTEILVKNNINIDDVLSHEESSQRESVQEDRGSNQGNNLTQLLKNFITDLTEVARQGKLEPMIGRVLEVERLEEILARKKKNNPIIVGDSGVGKTAIVEGLAQKIASGDIHPSLKGSKLLVLDLNGLIAGTKFRGDLEDRVKKIIDHVSNSETILFIDEIHTIVNAGKSSENGTDIGNTLKPYLSSGKIRCIGATTTEEYRQIFEKNSALSRRFNKVDVDELSPESTLHVLKQIKNSYENSHKVVYEDNALAAIVSLASRFLHNKKFPDKAIDILDEAGAYVKLRTENKLVTVEVIEQIISKMAKQPVKDTNTASKTVLKNLESNLKKEIFGQEIAVSKIVEAIVLAKSGFGNPAKPIGSYLFIGPTGVGKTELVKQLAKEMNMQMLRFDMSEYMESHSVSKLFGAPAGYVGYGKGGLLTEQVNKNPYSVVLLDEFEKAHPDVYNAFLQVFDYGFLTDSEGRKVDFRNTIVIMTSNVGIKLLSQEKNGIGFVKKDVENESLINWETVNKKFRPEFRNRLDGIVEFKPISKDMIVNIVNKNLLPIYNECDKNGIKLIIENSVIDHIAKRGYVPEMGARPVAKEVRELIAIPLAKLITFTDLPENSHLVAVMKDDNVEFEIKVEVPKATRTRVKKEPIEK